MRKTAAFAAVGLIAITLAGCNKPAETAEGTDAAAAAATTAAAAPAAATLPTGTFDVTDAAGKKVGVTTVNADGTYTDDDDKGVRTAGIVRLKDGKTCFDPSGAAPEECFTDNPPGPDGSFTTTDSKGAVLTVRPRAQ